MSHHPERTARNVRPVNQPPSFGYAVFGKVTDGMSVVDAIAKVKTGFAGPHQNVPEEPVVIKSVTIAE